VAVADGVRNLPRGGSVLRQMNEFAFTDALGFLMSQVETMDTYLDRGTASAERMRPAAGHRPRRKCGSYDFLAGAGAVTL
jgi:hypothetical protein